MTNAPGYPCPKCGNAVLYTHGAIGRPVWCFCRSCGTMFNPEHTGIQPVETPAPVVAVPAELVDQSAADALDAVIHEQLAQLTDPEPVPLAPNPEPDTPAPAERKRTMAPRPDPSTPFNDEELAKLPNWAQGKVRTLNAQLVAALEALNSQPAVEVQQNPDPTGLTVPCDGSCGDPEFHTAHLAPGALGRLGDTSPEVTAELLAQTRAELEELRYDYAARLARIAELVNDGLELAEVGEADGDEDE